MKSAGCCNATATAVLSVLTDRIESERKRGATNPDFLRGLEVAKVLVREALEKA
jgi:hypothetical protein